MPFKLVAIPDDTVNGVRYAHRLSCQTETWAMADVLTPVNIFHPLVLLSFGLEMLFCLQMLFDLEAVPEPIIVIVFAIWYD
jgi:hypothetical protein